MTWLSPWDWMIQKKKDWWKSKGFKIQATMYMWGPTSSQNCLKHMKNVILYWTLLVLWIFLHSCFLFSSMWLKWNLLWWVSVTVKAVNCIICSNENLGCSKTISISSTILCFFQFDLFVCWSYFWQRKFWDLTTVNFVI